MLCILSTPVFKMCYTGLVAKKCILVGPGLMVECGTLCAALGIPGVSHCTAQLRECLLGHG